MSNKDEAARRTHELDQSTAAFRESAQQMSVYFRELIAQGFTREEALDMTKTYQTAMIYGFLNRPKE
jgi:hypothetical protein